MSDLISRQAAIDAIEDLREVFDANGQYDERTGAEWAKAVINELPSAQQSKLLTNITMQYPEVLCGNCKHFEVINNDDHGWCKLVDDWPNEISARYDDEYCSFGERADT